MIESYLAQINRRLEELAQLVFARTIDYEWDSRAETGIVRGRIVFMDGSILEFSERLGRSSPRYRFHYMDADNELIARWDSAPHHREIATFPFHRHTPMAVGISQPVNLIDVLNEIEGMMAV